MTSRIDRVNRVVLVILGTVLVALGATALALSFGLYGEEEARQPVKPPRLSKFIADNPWFWWAVAVLAVVIGLLALRWLIAQLHTERLSQLEVESEPTGGETMLRSGALADGVEREVEGFLGVRSAAMRVRGTPVKHRHHLTVDLDDRADLHEVRSRLSTETVPSIRHALDFEDPNIDVRMVLSPRPQRRVR